MIANRREFYKAGLSPLYLPKYDILCSNLDPKWQPFFGIRSMEEQTELYAQGRTAPGKIVTKAPAGFSAHEYGCASDWTVFDETGQPLWLEWSDPRWDEYKNAVSLAGLVWGGGFSSLPDRPHNELPIYVSWGDVGRFYTHNGYAQALDYIKSEVKNA